MLDITPVWVCIKHFLQTYRNLLFTWNHVDFSGFSGHWAVQSYVQYLSLNCQSNSDNFSLSLPAQCLSPRWWLLWSCHVCHPGHCSGMSHNIAALLSTLLDSRWLCFSTFVPVAGVRELWFDTGSFIGCFGKCSSSVKGDLVRWSQTDVFEIPLEEGEKVAIPSNTACSGISVCILSAAHWAALQMYLFSAEMESKPLLI